MNRRDFHRLSLAGAVGLAAGRLPGAAKINPIVNGVTIGAQSYSFRDRHTDAAVQAFADVGIELCELWSGHLERGHGSGDSPAERERLRKWRETVSLDEIEAVGKQFRDVGVDVYAFNYSFRDDFSDREIERGFEMAKVLGAKVLTASSNVSTAGPDRSLCEKAQDACRLAQSLADSRKRVRERRKASNVVERGGRNTSRSTSTSGTSRQRISTRLTSSANTTTTS